MSISEDLQTRLSGLTQGPNPAPRRISNREMEMFRDASPSGKQFGVEIDGKDYDFSFDSKPTDETIQMLRERLGVKPNMDPGFFAATPPDRDWETNLDP